LFLEQRKFDDELGLTGLHPKPADEQFSYGLDRRNAIYSYAWKNAQKRV